MHAPLYDVTTSAASMRPRASAYLLCSLCPTANTLPPRRAETPAPTPTPAPRVRPGRLPTAGWWLGVAAVLASLAAPLIGQARTPRELRPEIVSGAPEIKRSESGRPKRWQQRQITVSIDDSVEKLAPGARDAVIRAFGAWLGADLLLPDVTFDTTEGGSAELRRDGRNTVMAAPIDIPGHRNDLAITTRCADPETGELLEADIIINTRHPFALVDPQDLATAFLPEAEAGIGDAEDAQAPLPAASNGESEAEDHGRGWGVAETEGNAPLFNDTAGSAYDLQNILTHEAGHFFGLGEDRDEPEATMFHRAGRGETKKRSLEESDTTTMAEIYAGGFDDPPEVQCTAVPADRHGSGPRPSALVLALLGLLGTLRRRHRAG